MSFVKQGSVIKKKSLLSAIQVSSAERLTLLGSDLRQYLHRSFVNSWMLVKIDTKLEKLILT